MKIGWVSPLQGDPRSKAVYFSKLMLASAPSWADITVLGTRGRHYLSVDQDDFDLFVFQLDNTEDCLFVYDAMHRFPGYLHLHEYHLPRATDLARIHRDKGEDTSLGEKERDFKLRGWVREAKSGQRDLFIPEIQTPIVSEQFVAPEIPDCFVCNFPVSRPDISSIKEGVVVRAELVAEERAYETLQGLSECEEEVSHICYSKQELEIQKRRLARFNLKYNLKLVTSLDELTGVFRQSRIYVSLRKDRTRGIPLEHYLAASCENLVISSKEGFTGQFHPELYPQISNLENEAGVLRELLSEDLEPLREESKTAFYKAHTPEQAWSDYEAIFTRGEEMLFQKRAAWI